MFPEYKDIVPSIWNTETQQMEAVPLPLYDKWLTGDMTAREVLDTSADWKESGRMDKMMASMKMEAKKGEQKSKMSELARGEQYNLAVGVYMGAVRAADRIKPISRTTADVDLTAMLRANDVTTAEDAVVCFTRRFLRTPLSGGRDKEVVRFLKGELGSKRIDYSDAELETALRRTLHLILSAPEYQPA